MAVVPAPHSADKRPWAIIGVFAGVVALVIALIVVAGSGDRKATTTTASSTPTSTRSSAPTTASEPSTSAPSNTLPGGIALTKECASPEYGFVVSYPDTWFAEESFPGWQCGLFDPEPFVVTPNSEIPPVDVVVSVAEFPFNQSVAQYTDPAAAELLASTDLEIDGHHAVAVEIATTQEVMLPAGTLRYAVLVDWNDRTLVVETNDVDAVDYTIDKQVVRGMADSLDLPPLSG